MLKYVFGNARNIVYQYFHESIFPKICLSMIRLSVVDIYFWKRQITIGVDLRRFRNIPHNLYHNSVFALYMFKMIIIEIIVEKSKIIVFYRKERKGECIKVIKMKI